MLNTQQHNNPLNNPIRRHLRAAETPIWTGQPVPVAIVRMQDILLLPLAGLWVVVATYAEMQAIIMRLPPYAHFLSISALLFGIMVSIGRLLWRYAVLRATTYVLTNQRVLVINTLAQSEPQSLDLDMVPVIERKTRPGKLSSVFFHGANGTVIVFQDLVDGENVLHLSQRIRQAYTPYSASSSWQNRRGFLWQRYQTGDQSHDV